MKFNQKLLEQRWAAYTFAICSGVALYLGLSNLSVFHQAFMKFVGYFFPVILGIVIAYIMNPMVNTIEGQVSRKIKNPQTSKNVSILLTVLIIVVCLVAFISKLVPQLISSLVGLIGKLDDYEVHLQEFIKFIEKRVSILPADWSSSLVKENGILNKVVSIITSNTGQIINTSTSIGSHTFNWIIGFILAIYFLIDKDRILGSIKKLMLVLFSPIRFEKIAGFWNRCNQILSHYIICELVEGLIIGMVNFIFMSVTGMPYAILISVVVGVTNMAPTFGPIVGAIIGGFILILANPWFVLWFLVFTIILQTIDGYIIKPKLYGETLGIPAIVILIAIVVGGRMFGMVGILLGIPVAAIIQVIYREYIYSKLYSRRTSMGEKDSEVKLSLLEKDKTKLPTTNEAKGN